MICASVYLLVFMRNLLMHLAEKILLMQPTKFGGDYRVNHLKLTDSLIAGLSYLYQTLIYAVFPLAQ